jgi:hypothetical protein
LDLLEKGKHACHRLRGPFCPRPAAETALAIGGSQGNAQDHRLLIDDVDEACPSGWLAQGMNDKALPEERVRRIGDFDLFRSRVLELGIKKWLLLTTSTMTSF